MTPLKRRALSASSKNSIAARQGHKCALVSGYDCPLRGATFDESGFHVDHIVELVDGGTDDQDNLQAICPACHSVKTQRARVSRIASKPKKKTEAASARRSKKPSEEDILTALHTSSPDDTSDFLIEHAGWNGTVSEFLSDRGVAFDKLTVLEQHEGYATLRSKLIVKDPKKLCVSMGLKKPKIRAVLNRKRFETAMSGLSPTGSQWEQEEILRQAAGDPGLNVAAILADCYLERRGIGRGARFRDGICVAENSTDPRDLNVYRIPDFGSIYKRLPSDIMFV